MDIGLINQAVFNTQCEHIPIEELIIKRNLCANNFFDYLAIANQSVWIRKKCVRNTIVISIYR